MKRLAGILIFFIIAVATASAVSTDLKQSYEKKETIIIEINGDILNTLSKENIEFRRGHILIPLEYDLKKLGNKYFLWAIAPENENNYTLAIKDILTTVQGRTESIDFEQNFSITGNTTDYYIKPGFIIANQDFLIDAYLNEDTEKTISLNFPSEISTILQPGKNQISFSIENIDKTQSKKIQIGKYSLIAHIIVKPEEENVSSTGTSAEIHLEINPLIISSTILVGERAGYPFQIINKGNETISGIRLGYNSRLFSISPSNYSRTLGPKKAIELNLTLRNIENATTINEIIIIQAGNFSAEMPVLINFTERKEEVKTPYLDEYRNIKYCSELSGVICTAGEICDAKTEVSLEGACCLGKCTQPAKSSKKWIGYLIAGIILLLLIFIFLKYKRANTAKLR